MSSNKTTCNVCGARVGLRSKGKKWLIRNHKDKRTGHRCQGVGKAVAGYQPMTIKDVAGDDWRSI